MAYGARRVLIYGAIGIMAAIIVSSSVLVLPNLITPVFGKTGTLVVRVTDAPVPLKNLYLNITGLAVLNASGGWIQIPIKGGEAYFDLLELQNVTEDLATVSLLEGNYTKIRMEILAANATFVDGTSAILRVPPGHIDIHVKNLEIKAGLTTSVTIDIMADKAQIANEGKSGKANLNPQFKTIVSPPS